MEYSQFSHISFDLWLTLIQSNPEYKLKRNRLMMEFFGITKETAFVDETYNHFDKVFNKINEITGGNIDAYELWLIFLSEVGVKINTLDIGVVQNFIDETEKLFFTYHPTLIDPKTPELFKKITDSGITISLL